MIPGVGQRWPMIRGRRMKLKIRLFPSSDRVRRIVTGVFVALLLAIPGSYVVLTCPRFLYQSL